MLRFADEKLRESEKGNYTPNVCYLEGGKSKGGKVKGKETAREKVKWFVKAARSVTSSPTLRDLAWLSLPPDSGRPAPTRS